MAVDMTKLTTTRGAIVAERVGRDGRSLTSEITTGTENVVLAVSTFHRNGGRYTSMALGVRHMPPERGFTITKSSPLDSVGLGSTELGARFSRKNLDSAHADAVTYALARLADGSAEFDRVIAATPEA